MPIIESPLHWKEPSYQELVPLAEGARRLNISYATLKKRIEDGRVKGRRVETVRETPKGGRFLKYVDGVYAPLPGTEADRMELESSEAFFRCVQHLRFYIGYVAHQLNLFSTDEPWGFLVKRTYIGEPGVHLHIQHLKATRDAVIEFEKSFFGLSEQFQRKYLAQILTSCYFEPLRSHALLSEESNLLVPIAKAEERVTDALARSVELPSDLNWGDIDIDNMFSEVRLEPYLAR